MASAYGRLTGQTGTRKLIEHAGLARLVNLTSINTAPAGQSDNYYTKLDSCETGEAIMDVII